MPLPLPRALLPLLTAAAVLRGIVAAAAPASANTLPLNASSRLLQAPPSYYTTCSSCASSPYYWCGGQTQQCVASYTSCPDYDCYAGAPSECSLYGAASCGPSSYTSCSACAGSPYYWCGSTQQCVPTASSCPNSNCVAGNPSQCSTSGAATCGSTSGASSYASCSACVGSYNAWCGGASQQCVPSPYSCPDASCAATSSLACATAGAAACSPSSPSGPSSLTTCAACTGTGAYYTWCGGPAQYCASYSYSCPSYSCSTSSSYRCASDGAATCVPSSLSASSISYYSAFVGDERPARASVAAGVAVSIVLALLLVPLLLCKPCEAAAPAPHLAAWAEPAQRAHRCLSAAFFFYTLGMLTALAAPAIPWLYIGPISYTGLTVTAWGFTFPNPYLLGGPSASTWACSLC